VRIRWARQRERTRQTKHHEFGYGGYTMRRIKLSKSKPIEEGFLAGLLPGRLVSLAVLIFYFLSSPFSLIIL